jgi:hypothetical protein
MKRSKVLVSGFKGFELCPEVELAGAIENYTLGLLDLIQV